MRVIWEIDVDEQDLCQASIEALGGIRDPQSTATVFSVVSGKGTSASVDLWKVLRAK